MSGCGFAVMYSTELSCADIVLCPLCSPTHTSAQPPPPTSSTEAVRPPRAPLPPPPPPPTTEIAPPTASKVVPEHVLESMFAHSVFIASVNVGCMHIVCSCRVGVQCVAHALVSAGFNVGCGWRAQVRPPDPRLASLGAAAKSKATTTTAPPLNHHGATIQPPLNHN